MQSLKRKLFWLTCLGLFVALVGFLCFCFVPLQNEDPGMNEYQVSYHESAHTKFGIEQRDCIGCHPFLWRFYHRWDEIVESWDETK